MNDINNVNNAALDALSIGRNQPAAAEEGNGLGQDAFLRLMIAQLENQDPLSPAENGEFIAQLAQFSSVEGITNLNDSVGTLVSEFRSSKALEASSLVGRQVEIISNRASLPEQGDLQASVDIPATVGNLRIKITDAQNNTVYQSELGVAPAGEYAFSWDGLDDSGERYATGQYTLEASAFINGKSENFLVRTPANIDSVSLGADNSMTLNVEGYGELPLDQVRKFL